MIWWKVCIPLQRELLRKCPQKTPSDTVRHIIQAIYPGIVEQANIKENEIQDLCKSIISYLKDIHLVVDESQIKKVISNVGAKARQKLGAESSKNSTESNNAVFAIEAQDDDELEYDQQQMIGDDTSNSFDDFSVN
ncbi:unnamed protein product [Didymodactylos carnosus]|uniref:Uncharacterized protein n=1 Tax=Didymodactylos carnosus TaxID=1234261 RepID=A0A815RE50_9BILA|nr:unnamed protein product [Didymodactylos carnosus]CAF4342346.1 unnamed protein product [Didymodactylos carnosus]